MAAKSETKNNNNINIKKKKRGQVQKITQFPVSPCRI